MSFISLSPSLNKFASASAVIVSKQNTRELCSIDSEIKASLLKQYGICLPSEPNSINLPNTRKELCDESA